MERSRRTDFSVEIETKKLSAVLRKFSVDDLRLHAMREFTDFDWSHVCSTIRKSSTGKLTNRTATNAILYLVKKSKIGLKELKRTVDVLNLRAFWLSASKTWCAHRMIPDSTQNSESLSRQSILSRLDENVGTSIIEARIPDDRESFLISIGRLRPIIAYVTGDKLFISTKAKRANLMQAIAKSFGYDSVKDCHLSGHHIPSLVQILDQKSGAAHLKAVISEPKYNPAPRKAEYGIDYSSETPMKNYMKELLGDENEAPVLPKLTIQAVAPFQGKRDIPITGTLSSSNVINSLREMSVLKLINPSSQFVKMVTEHCKSEIKVKFT